MSEWRIRLEPFTRPLFFAWVRLTRGMTLGVRGAVFDAQGRVLLVRHTYVRGWWLPGGGVERGQTAEAAVIRELHEEAGVIVEGRPKLVSIHSNEVRFRGDHVLIYRVDRFTLTERAHQTEIAEVGWFDPMSLPQDTNPGSRRRIAELMAADAQSDTDW